MNIGLKKTDFLTNPDHVASRKKSIERIKAVNRVRHHRVGGLDMFYRTQLTTKGNEYNSSHMYVEPVTKIYEKPPGTYKRNDKNKAFKKGVERKADEKAVKTFLTKPFEKTFNSEMNEILVFTNIKNLVGSSLSEKPRNSTLIDEIRFWFNCVADSIVSGRDENILFFFQAQCFTWY